MNAQNYINQLFSLVFHWLFIPWLQVEIIAYMN